MLTASVDDSQEVASLIEQILDRYSPEQVGSHLLLDGYVGDDCKAHIMNDRLLEGGSRAEFGDNIEIAHFEIELFELLLEGFARSRATLPHYQGQLAQLLKCYSLFRKAVVIRS